MRRAPALLLLPALFIGGCAADDEPLATPSATSGETPSATPTPSASPTLSPTLSPMPSATPSPTATTSRAPVAARDRDVDGDGRPDSIRTSDGLLSVTLTSTGRTVSAPVDADAPGAARVLGTADVDRDGRAEVFLQTAQGASTAFATPYRFDGTALRVVLRDGEPAQLGIGGSATHGDGFRCTAAGVLEVSAAQTEDGTSYRVTIDSYRLRGDQLVRVRTATVQAREGDPAVQQAYTVTCGSVTAGD